MAQTIVVFHSALGLRPAVTRFADTLRSAGHIVHTPDLFDGEVFEKLEQGVAKRDSVGIPELSARAARAVENLPEECVYAGFSMGAASAQFLAATRPGARAAILMHAALAPAMMGISVWPAVPVQIHYAERDPWVEADHLRALQDVVHASRQECDTNVYPGSAHLFTDADLPEHDRESYDRLVSSVQDFLLRV
jgi:dienelactone hydrolase